MDFIQVDNYMLVVEKNNTKNQYQNVSSAINDDYASFIEHCLHDMDFNLFLEQFGIDLKKPSNLQTSVVEQGAAILFTGKFYFEGYLEQGEYDLWDIMIGDAVLSFTKEEPAPFWADSTSFVEVSFEIVKANHVKL